MVINMTLGGVTFDGVMMDRETPDLGCGFAGTGLVVTGCAKAVAPRATMITTTEKKVDKKVEKRPDMASIAATAAAAARAASPRLLPR